LVQESMRVERQQAGLGRARLLAQLAAGQFPSLDTKPFDCDKNPGMCAPPFNCQTWTYGDMARIFVEGMAVNGEPNLRSWCLVPMYESYMRTCLVDKDLVKAGKIQYEWSLNMHAGVDEADASYCFIEGHCTNTAVTNETTLEEANKMCDERYGHEEWTKTASLAKSADAMAAVSAIPLLNMRGGFHDPRTTKYFLMAACAMGNYHCDVVYCKETYCKNPYYVRKYGHLLPRAPGHLLQSRVRVD